MAAKAKERSPGRVIAYAALEVGEMKSDLEWLTEMGLCHKCRKNKVAPGRKHCFDCLDRIREDDCKKYDPEYAKRYLGRRREIYREKKAKGICVRCSRSATHGMYCYEHSIYAKRRNMDIAADRKRKRNERGLVPETRKAAGLCRWCGQPALTGLQCCERHREIFSKAGQKGKPMWREPFGY